MAKRTIVDEEKDKFDKTRTGRAMNWLADRGKKGGNGSGSRVVKDVDPPDVRKTYGKDIKLPIEKNPTQADRDEHRKRVKKHKEDRYFGVGAGSRIVK